MASSAAALRSSSWQFCFPSGRSSAASPPASPEPAARSRPRAPSDDEQLLRVADALRSLGLSDELKLVTLVVAGNQSSGKSSVVEALAGVALPRAAGTCTRCPTEVRMRRDAPSGWCFRVKLREEVDAAGAAHAGSTPEVPFAEGTDPAHLTACVSAAQAALLNPSRTAGQRAALVPEPPGPDDYVAQHTAAFTALGSADTYELPFTPNKVVVEIDGASKDLTIMDLPGLIQTHPLGPAYVQLVRQLTEHYLSQDHVITVAVISAMDDVENQGVEGLARDLDPDGLRTLRVLTKPDNIPACTHSKWLGLVAKEPAGSDLGMYVVKNPGQDRLNEGISFDEARIEEADFFSSDRHWSRREDLAPRLGTDNLRAALARLLARELRRQLPHILARVKELIETTQKRLQELPPPPSRDAVRELDELLLDLVRQIRGQLLADEGYDKLSYQRLDEVYDKLGQGLVASMPAFLVHGSLFTALSRHETGLAPTADQITVHKLSFGQAPPAPPSASSTSAAASAARSPISGTQPSMELLKRDTSHAGANLRAALTAGRFPARYMPLEEVRALRLCARGRELPGLLAPSAVEDLIKRWMVGSGGGGGGAWRAHVFACLDSAAEELQRAVCQAATKAMGQYPEACSAVKGALAARVEALAREGRQQLEALVRREEARIYTANRGAYGEARDAYKRALEAAVQGAQQALPAVKDEVELVAVCLAYSAVVFTRLRDHVPLAVMDACVDPLARERDLRAHLWEHLARAAQAAERAGGAAGSGSGGSAAAVSELEARVEAAGWLLREDESLARKRRHLSGQLARLEEGLRVLRGLAVEG